MFDVREVTDEELTEFFIKDPALCYLGLPDQDLVVLHEEKVFKRHGNSLYRGLFDKERIVGIVCYEAFTELAVSCHFFISTKERHTGLARKIKDTLKEFCKKEYPFITKIIVTPPSTCLHIINMLEHWGFEKQGTLTSCIKWRNEVVDLIFYSKNISEI